MSMGKGTPAYLQIDWLERRVAELEAERDRLIAERSAVSDAIVEAACRVFYNKSHEGIVGWHELDERYHSVYRVPMRAALLAILDGRAGSST